MATLSIPIKAMLYGCFVESKRNKIDFSCNRISVEGLRAVEMYSRVRRVDIFSPEIVLEMLCFANRFCCEEMKSVCDAHLASLVCTTEDALILIEYGLDEMANLLVASCLQVFLRDASSSLSDPRVGNKAIFDSLRNNPKVHYDGKRFYYKSKHALANKGDLIILIRRFTEGIAVIDLKDSYPSVMEDLQVDDDLKKLFRSIELPRDMLDLEKDLQKNGMKPATNTTKRRPQHRFKAFRLSQRQKRRRKASARGQNSLMHIFQSCFNTYMANILKLIEGPPANSYMFCFEINSTSVCINFMIQN